MQILEAKKSQVCCQSRQVLCAADSGGAFRAVLDLPVAGNKGALCCIGGRSLLFTDDDMLAAIILLRALIDSMRTFEEGLHNRLVVSRAGQGEHGGPTAGSNIEVFIRDSKAGCADIHIFVAAAVDRGRACRGNDKAAAIEIAAEIIISG